MVFQLDPDGINYQRVIEPHDVILDYWHPWEKAKYIDYFETREKRKKEYPDYYNNSIVKKCQRDPTKEEFPIPNV